MAIANSDGSIIITTKLDVTPVSKALNALKSKFASLKEQRSAIQALTTAIKDQQFVIKDLEKEYAMLVAQGKGNSTNAEELKARIAELKAELQQLTGAASAMGVKTAAASTKAAQGLKQFGKRIAGIVKSALIFSLLYKVMQSVVKLFQNILMSDEEFRQDWEELKAAFYTAAYPIINLIVPAIKWIVQHVRDWAVSIGKVAAALKGMSYSELVDQAKASKEAADNYADMENSSKKTADNVKKQLASFDDIQILSSGNDEEKDGSYSGFEGLGEYDTSKEKSVLDDLMKTIGGALAAVGLILLFKGQIGWGVGFLVAGAAFWAIGEIWGEDYDPNSAVDVLNNIMQTIGVCLAAVGIILITKGILTWGFGFLIAGAAIWAITEFATGEFSTDPIVNTLVKIMGIAGTALLALGIILCVFGVINPVSISLIAAGATLLVASLALNSEAIVEAVRGPLGIIMGIVGAALLVLGIILVCTGVQIPLGIALIVAGAVALITPIALNSNKIVDWIKGVWDSIKSFWDKYIAPIFTAQFWLDLGKGALNGLIWAFELALNVITLGLRALVNSAIELINTIGGVIGLDWDIPTIPKISLPRLAQGAVIPGGKEFLAVLGDQPKGQTNIEAPLQTIVDAFNMALAQNGGASGKTEVVLEIDGREFGRAVVEQGNKESRRIGTKLVIA
jgi:cell division septum initiation protein DivIVA